MEAVHGPLSRTHTAPTTVRTRASNTAPAPRQVHSQNYGGSYNASSHTSAMSGSTLMAVNSNGSTLAMTDRVPSLETGPVVASDNIINQVADKDKSLYQICLSLRMRLSSVPGFEEHMAEMDEETDEDGLQDPVHSMWKCFQGGYPLMTVYNALNPASPLVVDQTKVPEGKRAKTAAFKFLQACLQELKFPPEDCFLITDLYGSDTTGFVKVTKIVNRVLDILEDRGLVQSTIAPMEGPGSEQASRKRTHRDFVVDELVVTERKYVQDLEVLQQFKKQVEERGVITGDAIHDIFLNLNALLDFQRRFLIRIEQTNSLPDDQQNWGRLFTSQRDGFGVYEPYIANQKRCEETAMKVFEKLKAAGGSKEWKQIMESPATLNGFLLKPFQRLSKYPLLLKELRDKGNLNKVQKDEIISGIAAATSVLERTNDAVDREARVAALHDLRSRVDDWKGHDEHQFGELLLYGTFTVIKNDSKPNNEREYLIYLFERILLCCKETNPNKQKNKIAISSRPALDHKGRPKLTLKGRIHMQNVTDFVTSKKETSPSSYTIQMFWKGDPGVENFVIKFSNEETMKKWAQQIETQLEGFRNSDKIAKRSSNDFAWMQQSQPAMMQNPYAQEEDDDEEEEDAHRASSESIDAGALPDSSANRTRSNSSLRSRSTTGESGPPMNHQGQRMTGPRFPPGQSPGNGLTLHTQFPPLPPGPSVADHIPASYFSPIAASPISTRTSSSSGLYPFPRQGTPNGSWHLEGDSRFPTPPPGRGIPLHRDDFKVGPGLRFAGPPAPPPNGRAINRPSLPAMVNQNAQNMSAQQNRGRSASTPNIDAHRMVHTDTSPVPDMPALPPQIKNMRGPINRSQNNSPLYTNGLPMRTDNHSPGLQRERTLTQSHQAFPQHGYGNLSSQSEIQGSHSAQDRRSGAMSDRTMSPPTTVCTPSAETAPNPTQLKVKVVVNEKSDQQSYITLVVGLNITYQSLIDRIDAKLSRFSDYSINGGAVRLRYRDDDGDLVTIRSDEDIQVAFIEWRLRQQTLQLSGHLGEIELFCHPAEG